VSFAKSVVDHDAKAFAEHVHPNAVFVEGDGNVLRGRDAVVEGWKSIVTGDKLVFIWHPAAVYLAGYGRVAVSRGPYYFYPKEDERVVRTGFFQSTWTLDTDGVWRVTIDGGTPPSAPMSGPEAVDAIAKVRAVIDATCKEP
jgi:uncharacterized protein (TIGR02246 family)